MALFFCVFSQKWYRLQLIVVLVDEDEATHIPPTEPLMGADDMRRDTTPDFTTNDMQSDPPLENDDFMDRDPRNLP